jgi:hypothetical protein
MRPLNQRQKAPEAVTQEQPGAFCRQILVPAWLSAGVEPQRRLSIEILHPNRCNRFSVGAACGGP